VTERIAPEDRGVTVGDLKRWLSSFADADEVIVEVEGMRYYALRGFNPPCGTEDRAQEAVCLVGAEEL
jgi:hypothetical protein